MTPVLGFRKNIYIYIWIKAKKKLCFPSLHMSHANLLYIISILSYDFEEIKKTWAISLVQIL